MATPEQHDTAQEMFCCQRALLIGFLPHYMNLLAHNSALEILPHRILWSLTASAAVIWFAGLGPKLLAALRNPCTQNFGHDNH
jgi:EamA domain-containing membrane protein RarD